MGISSSLGSSALLPAGLGFRNAIINGDFRINQRGFSSSTTNVYGFDRWFSVVNDGTVTYSSQTFTLGNPITGYEPSNFARMATSGQTVVGAYSILQQKIESVRTFAGQPVTISFWAKATSGTPKVSVELEQVFGTGGSPSSAVFTNFGTVTLSTSWTRYSVNATVASISGKTLGTNNDNYIGLNLWTSAGSTYGSRTNSIGIQNNTIDFWGVQVEQNYQATPFEQRPIGVELDLCQRYYRTFVGGFVGYSSNGIYEGNCINFGSPMRATPSVARISDTSINGFTTPFAQFISVNGCEVIALANNTGNLRFVTNYSAAIEL